MDAARRAAEAYVEALQLKDVLPALEAALAQPPSQEAALRASACFGRIAEAFLRGTRCTWEVIPPYAKRFGHQVIRSDTPLPQDRVVPAILRGLKMGLEGQGGLFTVACLLLPYVLHEPDCGYDFEAEGGAVPPELGELVGDAEDAVGVTILDTLLAGLSKFESESAQGTILMALRAWLTCFIENDGEDNMVALCDVTLPDDYPYTLNAMLDAGLLPPVVRSMERLPHSADATGSALAILSAVCGYHPPERIVGLLLAAGAMPPLVRVLGGFRGDLEILAAAIPLLKALSRCEAGARAAATAGADSALAALLVAHPSEPELHVEVAAIRRLLQPAAHAAAAAPTKAAMPAGRGRGGTAEAEAGPGIHAIYLY